MRILLPIILALALGGPAAALDDADRAAVRSTIESQLRAFLAEDSAAAYSFAAPNIKAIFPTEEIFMEMVRKGYPQVYRPRAYEFSETTEEAGRIVQDVEIVDADGAFWTARYTLGRQPDGSWKITSCTLLKKPGEVA